MTLVDSRRLMAIGLMLLACGTACGQRASRPATVASGGAADTVRAREHVQRFLDQYIGLSGHAGPAYLQLLSSHAGPLDSALATALREDAEFGDQRATGGSREGINFDPFLGSQDPCPRYEARDAVQHGVTYRVTVHPTCAGSSPKSSPVYAVVHGGGQWRIANVFYEKTDLRSLLCQHARRDTVHRARSACQGAP